MEDILEIIISIGILLFGLALFIGVCDEVSKGDTTQLPNGCILYNDVIYCEEAE